MTLRKTLTLTALLLLNGLVVPSSAQIPDEFTNLQVLDKEIGKGELIGMMRSFAGALGVRCNFCHPGGVGDSLEGVDFATDENHHKVMAREMLRMTMDINAKYVAEASDHDDPVRVKCVTCHRGQEKPRLIEDVLHEARAEGGMDALRQKYTSLREEYYGSHTYDFREFVLTSLAEEMIRGGDASAGKDLLEFNLSYYPESGYTHVMLAQALHEMGDVDGAIEALEKAVELDPENGWARRMLERAKASQASEEGQ